MSDTVNELLVNYWATGFFVIAALGLCAFMLSLIHISEPTRPY